MIHIPTEVPALEEVFERYHKVLNCFIVEPLLQGAGGMRMYDLAFLRRARELCDQYGILLILMRLPLVSGVPETALWQTWCCRIFLFLAKR